MAEQFKTEGERGLDGLGNGWGYDSGTTDRFPALEFAGNGVSNDKVNLILGKGHEFTTQQAADFLGVSRPYLVKLTDTGVIPCRKVGRSRRLQKADVVAYRDKSYAAASRESTVVSRLAGEGRNIDGSKSVD